MSPAAACRWQNAGADPRPLSERPQNAARDGVLLAKRGRSLGGP
jgi:hypothetical protein